MRRWLFLLATLPQLTGCMCYAYPTLAYTPEVVVDNRDGGAHAFRVDIDQTHKQPGSAASQYTLTQIAIDRGGTIPSQLEVATSSGVYDPFKLVSATEHERTHYSMTIRLYKPGSQTMEVQSWDKSKPIQWMPAADLLAQEKAIDDLLADPATPVLPMQKDMPTRHTWWELKDQKTATLGLQPGPTSTSQRYALHFAAGEYGRLANGPETRAPNMQAVRERLVAKAIWLKNYADQQGK